MFQAEHEDVLAAVDRIPIENSMGTQYFMDVTIGEPKQNFTVIFDTGSTGVPCLLPRNARARASTRKALKLVGC